MYESITRGLNDILRPVLESWRSSLFMSLKYLSQSLNLLKWFWTSQTHQFYQILCVSHELSGVTSLNNLSKLSDSLKYLSGMKSEDLQLSKTGLRMSMRPLVILSYITEVTCFCGKGAKKTIFCFLALALNSCIKLQPEVVWTFWDRFWKA